MAKQFHDQEPGIQPPLDANFRPLALANRAFRKAVQATGQEIPIIIALERGEGDVSRYETQIFTLTAVEATLNYPYVERLIKTLLWARGGWRVYIGGPREIGEYIQQLYSANGAREFDAQAMSQVYGKSFTVVPCTLQEVPGAAELEVHAGGFSDGCRVGFDAGASDRKSAAVMNGEALYSEEVIWDPKNAADPEYHFQEIMASIKSAAAHLPRVDAIGVSSAGVYFQNQVRMASLFRSVPAEIFAEKVTPLFLRIQQAWGGIPLEVFNDGDVTALAAAMEFQINSVLGVAMGSSEAAGYVTAKGTLTHWLNELAFVPIDVSPAAPPDEWSGDIGCGVQYLSQQAVGRLIPATGVDIDPSLGLPEQLKAVQDRFAEGEQRLQPLYATIGCYLGYAIALYCQYYHIEHVLTLGRVTTGEGGKIVLHWAEKVLETDFPELAEQVALLLPNEAQRRVGQAIAAASLPAIPGSSLCS